MTDPLDILESRDWLSLRDHFQNAEPFPSICLDNFLKADVAQEIAESYPSYDDANALGMEFLSVNSKKKIQVTEEEKFPEPVAQLSRMLASDEFRACLSQMTGIESLCWDDHLGGGGMHLSANAGTLDVHVDFNYSEHLQLYRRLNILIYLNPVWQESWGGHVELWDRDVKHCVQSHAPILNRCVLFETSDISFHGLNPVRSLPEGVSRNSFAAYYYTESSGENTGAVWGGNHSTIFKTRPNEFVKGMVAMPIENAMHSSRRLKSKIGKALRRVLR
ncbi:MAG: 2OG-Fe(II) oxygenase [Pseudomonadota bacterium]